MKGDTKAILEALKAGSLSVEEALLRLRAAPFEDIGFAKVDLHRKVRQGAGEVVYGAGKTHGQVAAIIAALQKGGEERILVTRLSQEKAEGLRAAGCAIEYYKEAELAVAGGFPPADGIGPVVVAAAGTSDIRVAEEAALTAQFYGCEVARLYDVGVAGIHRLFAHIDEIMGAAVIIAIAGMEGALASVIGGLADCPVIAVPTSVGYGASLGGLSALLSMLNSCASGVSVVNIDNGFGAGYLAGMINHIEAKGKPKADGSE